MLRSSCRESGCCNCTTSTDEKGIHYAEVQSPAALQEGFVFWASHGETSFPVKVPNGGVEKGQILRVPLLEGHSVDRKGHWNDGMFSCFKHGVWHPHLCNAWLCPHILQGQILTRMRMTWLADASSLKSAYHSTFHKIFTLFFLVAVFDILWAPPSLDFDFSKDGSMHFHYNGKEDRHELVYLLLTLPSTIYGLWVVVKLRAAIRAKYDIPTGSLGRMEDGCYVFWCNCCVMSQMARQTADYNFVGASWCSPNGIQQRRPSHVISDDGLSMADVV